MSPTGAETFDDEQADLRAALMDGAIYGQTDAEVTRIDTHGATVFLVGDLAFKLKKPVDFEYMDFSTRAKRLAALESELALNSATAPEIYRRILPVSRDASGGFHLGAETGGPEAEIVDHILEMTRFDEADLLSRMAERGALDETLIVELADAVAAHHEGAPRRPGDDGIASFETVIETNANQCRTYVPRLFDADRVEALRTAAWQHLERSADLIERRTLTGYVRRCHGDLHLRNIVLFGGRPVLIDALEFNETFAVIDVLYDLAFLLMDLWHRGLESYSNLAFNRYLLRRPEAEGLELLPFYLSLRAGIRAHVCGSMARWHEGEEKAALEAEAPKFFALAEAFLAPKPERLIAIGGLSGSGKTSVARALAASIGPAPGAVLLRSDETRKLLHGVEPTTALPQSAYTKEATAQVYAALQSRAASVLEARHAVIVDAVHAGENERAAIEAVAEASKRPFTGLWLDAPESVRVERAMRRRHDASDADAAVAAAQSVYELGDLTWHRLDATQSVDAIVKQARGYLEGAGALDLARELD